MTCYKEIEYRFEVPSLHHGNGLVQLMEKCCDKGWMELQGDGSYVARRNIVITKKVMFDEGYIGWKARCRGRTTSE